MPDSFTPDPERRSPFSLQGPPRPSGLPILCTERLTAAEREQLRQLRRHHLIVADLLDGIVELGRVDQALHVLQTIAAGVDGKALAIAARLGCGR